VYERSVYRNKFGTIDKKWWKCGKNKNSGWLVDEAQVNGIAFGVKTGDGNLCHPMEFRKSQRKKARKIFVGKKRRHKKNIEKERRGDTQILVAFTPEHFLHFYGFNIVMVFLYRRQHREAMYCRRQRRH
jgi:hypothetical protein